ncbi:hypothetical protein ACLM5H_16180 [Fredinandcohnia humi]
MIDTKPTKRHIANIKDYKKFLEKWDMWDFAYRDGNEDYFLAQYLHTMKGISGYLILDSEGEVVPFENARIAARHLIHYNTICSGAISQILPQMKKDISPLRDRVEALESLSNTISSMQVNSSIERIVASTKQSIEEREMIEGLFYDLGHAQREVTKEKGYFDLGFLHMMKDKFDTYLEILYMHGLRERELQEDYEVVIGLLESEEIPEAKNQSQLRMILRETVKTNKNELERSMATFFIKGDGIDLSMDRKDIRRLLDEARDQDGDNAFEKEIMPLIRNPR